MPAKIAAKQFLQRWAHVDLVRRQQTARQSSRETGQTARQSSLETAQMAQQSSAQQMAQEMALYNSQVLSWLTLN